MSSKTKLIASVFIFGTIGIFANYIPLPSSVIAMSRGLIGALFLLLASFLRHSWPNLASIRKNLPVLLLSGAVLGGNWILLFEAYKHTGVATATLCYYLAPVFVIFLSPLLFGEKLTAKKLCCALVALCGMIPVSGILSADGAADIGGILFGVGAALLYTGVVVLNKKLGGVSDTDRSLVQLAAAGIVTAPYALLTQDITALSITTTQLLLLLVVCVIHTGLAYMLYLSSVNELPAQTVAIFSYIDPITAILLSALLLHEPLGVQGIVGAVLILGATFFSEIELKKRKSTNS